MGTQLTTIEIELGDDGTLDRIYHCYCRACGNDWTERFSADYSDNSEALYNSPFPDRAECLELIMDSHYDSFDCPVD